MTLTLEVIGEQAAKLGPAAKKVFRDAGGSIGRLPDNAWPLPDSYVSSRHAMIKFTGGTFYIEDRSSRNGVFINSPDNRLAPGQAHPLRSGDWILIEPYEIRVSVEEAARPGPVEPFAFDAPAPVPAPQADPFWGGFSAAPPVRPDPASGFGGLDPIPADESLDPLQALFGGPAPASPPPGPRAVELDAAKPWSEPYVPPPAKSPQPPAADRAKDRAAMLPDDWDRSDSGAFAIEAPAEPKRPESPQPRPEPRPTPPAGRAPAPAPPPMPAPAVAGGQIDLAAVIAGVGLDHAAASPEFARDFGKILRIVVEGLMDVLRARRDLKREMNLGMTMLQPAENNPLKFSANIEDALHNMLVKRNAAYLGTVDAFEDALDDVRNDQMAMLVGMRAAFEMMLQEFDPDRLQQDFDQRGRNAIVATPAKMRYWDQYREKFRDMVKDPERCYRDLFGDEFAAAYDAHLKQMKSRGRR